MSSTDIIQLTRRYSDFCKEPEKIPCSSAEKDGYYLPWKACDEETDCQNGYDEGPEVCGNRLMQCSTDEHTRWSPQEGYFYATKACDERKDCENGSDETFVKCVNRCGSHVYVKGLDSIQGDYFVFGQSLHCDEIHNKRFTKKEHRKIAFYNQEKKLYLYHTAHKWYFGSTLCSKDNNKLPTSEFIVRPTSDFSPNCPTDHLYRYKAKKEWIYSPDITVTVVDNLTTTESAPLTTTVSSTITQRNELDFFTIFRIFKVMIHY